jgi:hypothetical protein
VTGGSLSAPICHGSDIGSGAVGMQGATETMAGAVSLRNTSSHDCVLVGIPTLTLLSRDGRTLAVKQGVRALRAFGGAPRWPGYPRVSLRPGQTADAFFIWQDNYCAKKTATAMRMDWHGVTRTIQIGMGRGETPPCNAPGHQSYISVFMFEPRYAPPAPTPRQLPLRVNLDVPHSATPGEQINYRVTLTNYSKRPVVFHRCPTYWQGVTPTDPHQITGATRALVLNCRNTRAIPPGGHRTYGMRYTIPKPTPPGKSAIVWTLEPVSLLAGSKAILTIR